MSTAPTICRDEALRIGGALALAMVHRPGWGWALTFNGKAFHAVLSTPGFHLAGQNGPTFSGQAQTPSKALDGALAASAGHSTHDVRRADPENSTAGCRCSCPACPG